MPDFVNGPELSRRLATALRDSTDVRLAVAFWGDGAADALGIPAGAVGFRVVCNLLSGGTNPQEIRTLRERGVEVRQLNDLHAKIGVTNNLSFLGSSNMSTNGLGDEGTRAGWREANIVYPNARPEISKIFDDFWRKGAEINETDLNVAEAAWAARRKCNAIVAAGSRECSLVDVLRYAPEHLDALNVRMVVHDIVTDEEEVAILDRGKVAAHRRYGEAFEVYLGWDRMETEAKDAYLVNYERSARGTIEQENLYRRDPNFDDFEEDGETFHPAYEIVTIKGIAFESADRNAIRDAFYEYVRNGHTGENGEWTNYNFPISELQPYLP